MHTWAAAGLAMAGALLLAWRNPDVVRKLTSRAAPELARALAEKWGRIWGVPSGFVLTIMKIESAFRPGVSNTNERAMKLGGAWGLMAMTLTTARGLVPQVQQAAAGKDQITKTHVAAALSHWNNSGQSLLDPELNTCLGAFFLAKLYREFKTLRLVAAAYHQGAGKVRQLQATSKAIPAALPPLGREYVARAEAAAQTLGVT